MATLFHHRWTIPVLAALDASRGARFVALARGLGVGRETLRQTLDALLDCGLVARNPGHGHPLRPEYVLGAEGARVAPACATLLGVLRDEGVEEVGLRKWSVPTVLALRSERRFGELRRELGATPRALSLCLRALEDAMIVARRVEPGYPPASVYGLTARGRRIRAAADALVTRET